MEAVYTNCPDELKAAIAPLVDDWKEILPTWLQSLEVLYGPEKEGSIMEALTHYPNRWTRVTATGHWLAESAEDREVSVIHEFIHVVIDPLARVARTLAEQVGDEGSSARRLADQMVEDAMESVAEDLARALIRLRRRG